MAKQTIPTDIQTAAQHIVETYNRKHNTKYQVRFRGKFCYLSRIDDRSKETHLMNMAAKMLGLSKSMINQATVSVKPRRFAERQICRIFGR